MSRTRNTQLLAIVSALNLMLTSVCSIITGRLVLVCLGSEYNGINSIVAQFLTILSVLEGGFTTASLVALMKPYEDRDVHKINQLFAETRAKFNKISVLSLLIGCVVGAIYGGAVKTSIPYLTVVAIILIGVISSTYNVGVITKYRMVFQAAQEEHLFAGITLITTLVGQIGMMFILVLFQNIIFMRTFGMLMSFSAGLIIKKVFLKRYSFIEQNAKWDGTNRIEGTRDVMIGKVVGTIHSSSSVFFLSVFGGAAATSVYAVYNSIINIIVHVAKIGFNAPQNAIGQVLQNLENENKKKIVLEYEYLAIVILTILFVPLSILIVPFVRIYTQGVDDVQYIDNLLAALMVVSAYIQLIHIPAGVCIYMSGHFSKARNIQSIALVVLILGNIVMGNLWGIYGFVVSVLLCNAFLAVTEIMYLHKVIIPRSAKVFIQRLLLNFSMMLVMCVLGWSVSGRIESIISCFLYAIIITLLSIGTTLVINKLTFRKSFDEMFSRITSVIYKKRKV